MEDDFLVVFTDLLIQPTVQQCAERNVLSVCFQEKLYSVIIITTRRVVEAIFFITGITIGSRIIHLVFSYFHHAVGERISENTEFVLVVVPGNITEFRPE